MAPGETWTATRYDRSSREHVNGVERAGEGCSRVLRSLAGFLRGGLDTPGGEPEGAPPARGQFHGAALWDAKIVPRSGAEQKEEEQTDEAQGWASRISESGVLPHEQCVIDAARLWYGCRRPPHLRPCDEPRCPACWDGADLQHVRIRCSRFKHNVSAKSSSGLGRLKGGNVRLASNDGPSARAWAVGDDSGEDVEIFRNPTALRNGTTGDGGVTLAKILYFFTHEGNRRAAASTDEGPQMEYVLVYEYVTCGPGRSKRPDSVTQHPTYFLRGNPAVTPSVFPAEAIRRHVHMYHLCPQGSFTPQGINNGGSAEDPEGRCGLRRADGGEGGGFVWKHHFNLTGPQVHNHQRDTYMLNEHWHSSFQDGVV